MARSKAKKPPFRRVVLRWVDAYSVDAWTPVENLQKMIDTPAEHLDHLNGYVVAENKDWIVVANALSWSTESGGFWNAAACMVVPRRMIVT